MQSDLKHHVTVAEARDGIGVSITVSFADIPAPFSSVPEFRGADALRADGYGIAIRDAVRLNLREVAGAVRNAIFDTSYTRAGEANEKEQEKAQAIQLQITTAVNEAIVKERARAGEYVEYWHKAAKDAEAAQAALQTELDAIKSARAIRAAKTRTRRAAAKKG